jgi:RNA polymerase sigma-70 factor (ECF subfamily)
VSSTHLVAGNEPGRVSADRASVDTAEDIAWIYDRYHQEVFHLALRYGRGNAAWAEDVTQDIFLALLRFPRVLRAQQSLSGWFYRVTTNRCLNQLRKETFLQSAPVRWLLGTAPPSQPTPESLAMAKDELSQAFQSVNALPAKERVVFFMVHVDGWDQTEAARMLGHSKGYVSKLLKRAEERLTAAGWKVEHHAE